MTTFLSVAFLTLMPLAVEFGRNLRLIKFLSPVVTCYILGIFLGNIGLNFARIEVAEISQLSVAFSIPLLLLSTNFKKWLTGARCALISFILMIISVTLVVIIATFLFKEQFPEVWKISGMLVGVYTGGTPNLSAIGLALNVPRELFILINGSDMVLGGLFLLFIFTIGPKILQVFLKAYNNQLVLVETEDADFFKLNNREKIKNITLMLFFSASVVSLSLFLSHLFFGELAMGFFMLTITSLGVLASFVPKLHKNLASYKVGQYLLLIFCLGIGSQAEIKLLISQSSDIFWLCFTVMVGSFVLHVFLCYLFKIDRDTTLITSVAGIFGPPFIGPVADSLKNKNIIMSGMTCSLVGFAFGNYLGLGLAKFLEVWLS